VTQTSTEPAKPEATPEQPPKEGQAQPQPQRGGPSVRSRRPRSGHDEGFERPKSELTEKVVFINRCAKVVKGGRRFSFSALVVAGDGKGAVGYGFGKANEVSEAIRKGTELARRSMVKIAIRGSTIPHEVEGVFGGGRVLLRPASTGTGIVAGGGVRAVVEAAGIRDIIGKTLGPSNIPNVVKATLQGLQQLRMPEDILQRRGLLKKPAAKK
jgi:small subunit ribosomal protein S5